MKIARSIQHPQTLRKAPPVKRSMEALGPDLPVGPTLVGSAALAMGTSLILSKDAVALSENIANSVLPGLSELNPVLNGVTVGAFSGALAGVTYWRIASAGKSDAEPLIATIGGGITGLALGSLSGGIAAACRATPMLAVPVSLAACVAFSFRDFFDQR